MPGTDQGAERDRIKALREHLRRYDGGRDAALADRSDEEIAAAIAAAREWVGGRRYSTTIVAANVLRDGRPHA